MLKSSIDSYESIQNNLPKGWIKTRIKEICKTKSGGTPSRKNPNYFGGKIPWIKSGELNDSVIYSYAETITKLGLEKSNAVLYPKNTVLLAMYGATIGKISILGISASTNQAICAFYRNEKIITNLYLFWFLKSIRKNLLDIGFGGAQKNISQEKIKQIWILLPPLNEQKRIVSKIESIFSQIDAVRENLERLASQVSSASGCLEQLKSSVLKQAFEGRLVPQDPKDEFAEVLLKRLHKDSEKKLEFEKEGLPEDGLGQKSKTYVTLAGGGTPSRKIPEYFDGNIPWFTPTEIPKDKIVEVVDSREKITEFGLQKSSAKIVPPGSVLLTSRASIGFIAISGVPVTTNQGFASFICSNVVYNYFLAYWLWANRNLIIKKATGTTFKEISKTSIRQLWFNLPPFPEQKRIITEIESIFGKIDAEFIILKITYSVMIFVFLHLYARTAVFFDYLDPYSISSKHGSK